MTELAKHIEILLLDNDCVIVPGFGGFMAHPVSAVYDSEEDLFLPPSRTVGFNSQLKVNDSLLAQSYVEAYDISYPEALRQIEGEVEEINQTLAAKGSYEFPDVGVILLNEEGKYDFEPCLSGILTPNLYALNSFEMPLLSNVKKEMPVQPDYIKEVAEVADDENAEEKPTARVISINIDKLKHTMATAAVVLFLILFSIPFGENRHDELKLCSIDSNMLFRILPHIEENGEMPEFMVKADEGQQKTASPTDVAENKLVQDAFNIQSETKDETSVVEKANVKAPASNAPVADKKVETKQERSGSYVIVLASNVSRANAETFISKLRKSGVKDARILEGKHLKVVCGSYNDQTTASNEFQKLRKTNKAVTDGWFLKL